MLETRKLETRKPMVSTRTRRLDALPRTAAPRVSSAAATLRPQTQSNAALDHVPPAPRPVVRPAAPARQSRLGRSEMRLMCAATTCTAVVCGLLLLYLAAYAHVTSLGIAQSQARAALRENRLQNETLRARCAALESPQHVIDQATKLGMTPRGATPVEYIAAPALQEQTGRRTDGSRMAKASGNGEQGTNGGTTADNRTAASFNH